MESQKKVFKKSIIIIYTFLQSGLNMEIFISRSKLCGEELPEEDSLEMNLLKLQTTDP